MSFMTIDRGRILRVQSLRAIVRFAVDGQAKRRIVESFRMQFEMTTVCLGFLAPPAGKYVAVVKGYNFLTTDTVEYELPFVVVPSMFSTSRSEEQLGIENNNISGSVGESPCDE